ncbi:MAG: hypothetical protein ACOY3D_05015 [Candidatus Omnitrophota bacterium]
MSLSPTCFGQGAPEATGRADVYRVFLTTFEIYNGVQWLTLFSGTSSVVDIASAPDTSTSPGNFLSGLSVPDGTYSQVRVTPADTFTIKGSVTNGATSYYTTSSTGSGGGCLTSTSGPAQECTLAISGVTAQANSLSPSITVTNGVPDHRVRVNFDTSNALGLHTAGPDSHKEIFPEVPTVTISVQ